MISIFLCWYTFCILKENFVKFIYYALWLEQVMEEVMRILHHRIPPFIRIDFVHVSLSHSTRSKYICFELTCNKFDLNHYVKYLFSIDMQPIELFLRENIDEMDLAN